MFMGGSESAGNPWRNSFSASLQHWVNKPVSSAQTWIVMCDRMRKFFMVLVLSFANL